MKLKFGRLGAFTLCSHLYVEKWYSTGHRKKIVNTMQAVTSSTYSLPPGESITVLSQSNNELFEWPVSIWIKLSSWASEGTQSLHCLGFQKLCRDLNGKNGALHGSQSGLCLRVMAISLGICGDPNSGRKYGSDSFA